MKCPKCGGEIAFYDLRPNCRHCGVNIMYYTQDAGLMRDAKRTELEGAAARMVIARIKAAFIGSKAAVARLVFVLAAVAALVIPFGGVGYTMPFFDGKLSVGVIGLIQAYGSGLLLRTPQLLGSTVVPAQTRAAVVAAGVLAILAVLDVLILAAYLLSFLNLTGSAKFIKTVSLIAAVAAAVGQGAIVAFKFLTKDSAAAHVTLGYGAAAAFALYLVLYFLNRHMIKKGIEPVYRENDVKRREMLKKVRAGEVDLDSLPLPVFESEEERAERMKALEEALRAEEEGKEL